MDTNIQSIFKDGGIVLVSSKTNCFYWAETSGFIQNLPYDFGGHKAFCLPNIYKINDLNSLITIYYKPLGYL
jgi:hypothetical protein